MKNQYEKLNFTFSFMIAALLVLIIFIIAFFAPDMQIIREKEFIFIVSVIAFGGIIFYLANKSNRKRDKIVKAEFPENWRSILEDKVDFYRQLSAPDKAKFENQAAFFLIEKKITGIQTEVTDEDRLLVAASAVIPVFGFDEWEYFTLEEVLLYPGAFDEKFRTGGSDKAITGMVGTGIMDKVMILSKPALHYGFENAMDKKNVGIHEFIHLIDRASGEIDGIPPLIIQNQYVIPWLYLARKNIEEIMDGDSDINSYGATNMAEFLAVAGEYFFERPDLLSHKHPELYKALNDAFSIDMKSYLKNKFSKTAIGRNTLCPCGSGQKYKRCCMKNK